MQLEEEIEKLSDYCDTSSGTLKKTLIKAVLSLINQKLESHLINCQCPHDGSQLNNDVFNVLKSHL